jgi:hypothetical protein
MFDKVKGIFGKKKPEYSSTNPGMSTVGLDTINKKADEAAAAEDKLLGGTSTVTSPTTGGSEDDTDVAPKNWASSIGNLASSGLSAAGNIAGMFGPKNAPANSND